MDDRLDLLNAFRLKAEKEKHLACYRTAIRRARPYTLDADAVSVITELASGETIQDKLAIYRRLARLPFDTVWIEFDYLDRFRARAQLGTAPDAVPEDAPSRMGWLMERLTDTSWRATTIVWYDAEFVPESRTVDAFAITHVVSTEGPVEFRTHTRDPALQQAVRDMNRDDQHPNYSAYAGAMWGFGASEERKTTVSLPLHLNESNAIDLAPSWETILLQADQSSQARRARVQRLIQETAMELQGDLRFICATLALLNNVPMIEKTIQRQGSVRMAGGIKPYMVNRIVSIDVPKRKGRVRSILSMLRLAEIRMRRHQVCGHWKRVRGTGEIKWVADYWRGDAGLGYVDQVREVTSSVA